MKRQYIQPALQEELTDFEMELMVPIVPSGGGVDDGFSKTRDAWEEDELDNKDSGEKYNGWPDGLW